tara:strand:- start:1379 stop:2380 length:1002 start_codon:yes stop_codon:yes gene_type:complete
MADNPATESASKPTNSMQETQQAFANLIATSRSEEPKSETKEAETDNLATDNELSVDDVTEQDLVENEETTADSNQELYDVTVNGQTQKVNLDELKQGYSKGLDYTKKTMDLGDQRRSLETEKDTISKEKDEVSKLREEYAKKLSVVEQNLQVEDNIDWVKLAQDDPSDYAIKKAEYDKKKDLQARIQKEQARVNEERKQEQEKVYQSFIQSENKKLIEKMPVFGDEKKVNKVMQDIGQFALKSGYTEQELNMLVDHRALITLYQAAKYDQLLQKKGLQDKKVKTNTRMVTSEAKNETQTTDKKIRVNDRMKQLKRSGSIKDAQKVLSAMLTN